MDEKGRGVNANEKNAITPRRRAVATMCLPLDYTVFRSLGALLDYWSPPVFSKSFVFCLCGTITSLASFAASGASLEELHAFRDKVEASYSKRTELLRRSTGAARMQFREVRPPADFAQENPGTPWEPRHDEWKTQWSQKGDKYRYDIRDMVEGEKDARAVYQLPYDMRVAADNESSLYYTGIHNEAYLDKRIERSCNILGLRRAFKPEYCYAGPELDVPYPEGMKAILGRSDGSDIVLSDVDYQGRRCVKWSYYRKYENRPRLVEVHFIFDPAQAYSLVHAEELSNVDCIREKRELVMELVYAYDAKYALDPSTGAWLATWVKMRGDYPVGEEEMEIFFDDIKVGVDVPDSTFTFEGLGVPAGAKVYDMRQDQVNPTISYYEQPAPAETR